MKSELNRVKAALAGPTATTLTARMVKLQSGRLWAYGGSFCLSVPYDCPLECAFLPKPVQAFFSIDRDGYTVTQKDNVLVFRHGKSEHKVKTVPAHTMPVLQVIGPRVEVTEQIENLDIVASLSRNNEADFTQAAWFRDGNIYAMRRRSVCFATAGLPEEVEMFGIQGEAVHVMSTVKSPLRFVVMDQTAVQFEFEDGTWLAARKLDGLEPPDFGSLFIVEDDNNFQQIEFTTEAVEEVRNTRLFNEDEQNRQDMIWFGENGILAYLVPGGAQGQYLSSGSVEDAYTPTDAEFKIHGEVIRTLLALEISTVQAFGLKRESSSAPYHSFLAFGEGFAMATVLTR